MRMKYIWDAIYSDGGHLPQFNEDGTENPYTTIDRSKLIQFLLIDTNTGKPKIILHLKPGQKLIHRRRVSKRMPLSSIIYELNPEFKEVETVWIVGWHENRRGVNVQIIFFAFEDGSVEVMDRWDESRALYSPIRLIPDEELDDQNS